MKIKQLLIWSCVSLLIASCVDSSEGNEQIDNDILDPKKALNTSFDGKIFSIPSPIQTALLIKSASSTYYEDMLNPISNSDKYTTEYSKALNLGVYGADLGYSSLYNQKGASLKYLSVVEKLTSSLGLEGAFDKTFVEKYERNVANQDSMMIVVADAFRKADLFLKNAKRKPTSSLILTGGWIESMHFACQLTSKSKNQQIINRIGEQRQTLESICAILKEYNKKGANDNLLMQMEDLLVSFDAIVINYTYVEPKTNVQAKTTTLNHSISFEISEKTLNEITNKISVIRASIIS